ncbi:MAG: bifunctional riboflavin kinase/FAD synthetase [Acholeplasmataceae bacterium]|jgi:riboflavin kinase/FMN adenylyltransferase
MKVIKGKYYKINNQEPLALAIGNFDGVHLGHQSLINQLLTFDSSYQKGVLTFTPHTMQYFTHHQFQTIHTVNDKINELLKFPIDKVYLVEFDAEFSSLEIHEMIEFLKRINVKKIVVGSDFRFGKKGLGKPSDLANDFEVYVVKDVYYHEIMVSSTLIKDYIANGNLSLVRELLNHEYLISAVVIAGNQIGRTIGFPTANLDYDNLLLPPNGVYFVKVHYQDSIYFGMANIGYNPTINFTKEKKLEVHIIDFDQMIYGKTIKIEFIKWLRPEKKFNSKADLIMQLENDRKDIIKLSKTYEIC